VNTIRFTADVTARAIMQETWAMGATIACYRAEGSGEGKANSAQGTGRQARAVRADGERPVKGPVFGRRLRRTAAHLPPVVPARPVKRGSEASLPRSLTPAKSEGLQHSCLPPLVGSFVRSEADARFEKVASTKALREMPAKGRGQ